MIFHSYVSLPEGIIHSYTSCHLCTDKSNRPAQPVFFEGCWASCIAIWTYTILVYTVHISSYIYVYIYIYICIHSSWHKTTCVWWVNMSRLCIWRIEYSRIHHCYICHYVPMKLHWYGSLAMSNHTEDWLPQYLFNHHLKRLVWRVESPPNFWSIFVISHYFRKILLFNLLVTGLV